MFLQNSYNLNEEAREKRDREEVRVRGIEIAYVDGKRKIANVRWREEDKYHVCI